MFNRKQRLPVLFLIYIIFNVYHTLIFYYFLREDRNFLKPRFRRKINFMINYIYQINKLTRRSISCDILLTLKILVLSCSLIKLVSSLIPNIHVYLLFGINSAAHGDTGKPNVAFQGMKIYRASNFLTSFSQEEFYRRGQNSIYECVTIIFILHRRPDLSPTHERSKHHYEEKKDKPLKDQALS